MQRPVTDGPATLSESNSGTVIAGGWWRWDVLLCLVVSLVSAALLPLDDTDLPMHLRTGAWILEHGAVPFVEPFAWTRDGAPFYAYSWLPEVLYQLAWQAGGAWGLGLVHGVFLVASGAAVWYLARAAHWSVWATRLVIVTHLILWSQVQPATRPQLLLATALPLIWAAAFRIREAVAEGRTYWWPLCLAFLASVLAVNAHILYPLTVVPVVVLLGNPRFSWRSVVALSASTVAGWMCTPYLTHAVAVFRLNFGRNALFNAASPIMEHEGGFAFLTHSAVGMFIITALLLFLPLLPVIARLPNRDRWWMGMAWAAGLGLFGLAIRGLLLWWLLALPWVALAFASIPLPTRRNIERVTTAAWAITLLALIPQALKARRFMPTVEPLPHEESVALAPAIEWLTCHLASEATLPATSTQFAARGVTVFNYGSYLAWRLPAISWSIDGRTIFPDSVAVPESRQELRNGPFKDLPWRTADLLLIPPGHATALAVRADTGWQQVPLVQRDTTPSALLWVRRGWLSNQPLGRLNACRDTAQP